MTLPVSTPCVLVHLDRLRRNFALLRERTALEPGNGAGAWPALMPVIKADAYGHGQRRCALNLIEAGAGALGLGPLGEVADLRSFLESQPGQKRVRLVALLGVHSAEEAEYAARHGITPLVSQFRQLDLLDRAARRIGLASLPLALKFNTGMSRLGFAPESLNELLEYLGDRPVLKPELAVSHLASADVPAEDAFSRCQFAALAGVYTRLRAAWPDLGWSLSNSAGFLAESPLFGTSSGLEGTATLASLPAQTRRPGLAVYGLDPFAGASRQGLAPGLLPVMEFCAPVMEVRELRPGDTVSYCRTYKAQKASRAAILRLGYSDCLPLRLSNQGQVVLRGRRAPIIGRVCMQMLAVGIDGIPGVQPGDMAFLLGGEGPAAISMAELAADWGSIPYEAMCVLGKNPKVYLDVE